MSGSMNISLPLSLATVFFDDGIRRSYDYSEGAERINVMLAEKRAEYERRLRELEPLLERALQPWLAQITPPTAADDGTVLLTVSAPDVGIRTFREASVTLRVRGELPMQDLRAALRPFLEAVLALA